jgi:excisionase family DNA binding protein
MAELEAVQELESGAGEAFLTVDETARLMKVRADTVRRWLRSGTVRGRKFGKSWRIAASELQRLEGEQLTSQPASQPASQS